MTASQYRAALKRLGLSQRAAARLLGINERTSRRWATDGKLPKPASLILKIWLREKSKGNF